ncbi:MAG: DNA polymerase III subunit alpha [Ruminococcaceae bacterium]|nr:DNA polymerase III subunit alpha [Oscillospiraceae bacterium]
MGTFTHLHLHSEYSLLDGACRISALPKAAKQAGHTAVALTDHGVLYGAVRFYKACVAEGIKPIIGCEVYVARRTRFDKDGKRDSSGHHLVLLAKNEQGYRNLIQMVSLGFTEGFYTRPRIDKELLRAHSAGLVALSGCVAGEIPQKILEGDIAGAKATALEMRDIFEPESFYLEIQNHGIPEEKTVREAIRDISAETGIPMVATNDVHYIRRVDSEMQAVLMCIQTGSILSDGRPMGFERDEFYYKSTVEMEQLFRGFDGAVENTEKIEKMCNFSFSFGEFKLPVFPVENGTPREELARLASDGFLRLKREGRLDFSLHSEEAYLARMSYELSVIHEMGFDEYYLIVRDFVGYAKDHDIPVGPGRGSGAGSLVAFFLGITDVDSLKYNLLFERFLNPERISMPDFDIDFCYSRRDEVIDYVKHRYGADHVAQIVTFGTLAARAAVRDVGRVLGMSYKEVDEIAKSIPHALGITIRDALKNKELSEKYDASENVRRLLDISMEIEGMPRHASTHAAGVVITEHPVAHYVPLALGGDAVVTQYDMDAVSELGLVKFDFLGLRYLTILKDAENEVKERIPSFSLEQIAHDDADTYKMLSDGDTSGVFQLESGGMRQMLTQLMPSSLEEITAAIALYRPGPMDAIPSFIARKHGKEKVTYDLPEMEDILSVTNGCIVYQEQVMQIFRALAGYSLARADLVRRAMSKKKADVLEAERERFLSGCLQNGIDPSLAGKIFDDMASFANYAFNKSHATAYAVTTYRTAYLKKHYPAAYFCALLTSVLGSPPKVAEYIGEAHKRGIRVLPPDINESRMYFHVHGENIRFGLLALKNVGVRFVEQLIAEREANGPFNGFEGFLSRMADGELGKRQVESLIKSGAFDSFGVFRSQLLSSCEELIDTVLSKKRGNVVGQLDIFSALLPEAEEKHTYPDIPEFSTRELLLLEKESSGMYFSGHLLDDYKDDIAREACDGIRDILSSFEEGGEFPAYKEKDKVTVCGMITAKTVKNTRNGAQMAFLTLEDRYAEIEIIVFPKQLEGYHDILLSDTAVRIRGTLSEREEDGVKLLLSSAEPLISNAKLLQEGQAVREEKKKDKGKESCLYLRVPSLSAPETKEALEMVRFSPGDVSVLFYDASTGKTVAPKDTRTSPTSVMLGALRALLGDENVVLRM